MCTPEPKLWPKWALRSNKESAVAPPDRNPRHPPDAHVDGLFAIAEQIGRLADAQERNAAAMERQAEATLLLARVTAGEFDEQEEVPEPASKGRGMGMG